LHSVLSSVLSSPLTSSDNITVRMRSASSASLHYKRSVTSTRN
jgi:hypothetical protein